MSTAAVPLPAAADPKIINYGAFTPDAVRQLMRLFAQLAPNAQLGLIYEYAADGLTATGNSQATALATTTQTTRISTTPAGTGILLPPSAPGLEVLILNDGANDLQVYGVGTDTIDGAAAAVGVSQMASSLVIYTCAGGGRWRTEGLSTGYDPSVGLQTLSRVDGLVANVGQVQAGATPLTRLINRIATCAAAGNSCVLPAAVAGLSITVINSGANASNIFPNGADAINALAASAAFSQAAGAVINYYCVTAGQWFTK